MTLSRFSSLPKCWHQRFLWKISSTQHHCYVFVFVRDGSFIVNVLDLFIYTTTHMCILGIVVQLLPGSRYYLISLSVCCRCDEGLFKRSVCLWLCIKMQNVHMRQREQFSPECSFCICSLNSGPYTVYIREKSCVIVCAGYK